jgi:hypothetical protein
MNVISDLVKETISVRMAIVAGNIASRGLNDNVN